MPQTQTYDLVNESLKSLLKTFINCFPVDRLVTKVKPFYVIEYVIFLQIEIQRAAQV